MDLRIKEVAEMLNVSESTIRRWITEGMPAYRINSQYRLNRSEIEDWVMQQKRNQAGKVSPFARHETADDLAVKVGGNQGGFSQYGLFRALHKGQVFRDTGGANKSQVIRNAMGRIATHLELDADVLTNLLLDRENLMPTALNNGIAVPHTRDFLLSGHYDMVSVVFPKEPIEYGALDNQPVHTLFFLFACDDKRHLNLLAKIAHWVSQPGVLPFLKTKPPKAKLLDSVKEWEGTVIRKS